MKKVKINQYEKKESYPAEDILKLVPDRKIFSDGKIKPRKYILNINGDMIKMASDRYYTFLKSLKCAYCSIEGKFMRKERILNHKGKPTTERFHFNLYAINSDGDEVLMTKDHIIPKSKGGHNSIRNYQTCCVNCNSDKSSNLNYGLDF